ncbi:transglutaminase family protein [Pseudomarimonas salicorniae]|uniref:Transglutaminase family protein n=1 Tax=Pseudomarimonas salicorniae TaxID=2933270 RepID=A0ABT0GJR5_9GAMM|nr:transglutaminase family protein [Lysobacter sp. CAU 1642]MCK7594789.1 transglutaminase family protein [Lysobacter sp. CAU 1642]
MSALPSIRAQRYRVLHDTHYDYAAPVSLSEQLLHLAPRPLPRQRVIDWSLDCDPEPGRQEQALDAFGNPVVRLQFDRPHAALSVRMAMQVSITPRAPVNVEDSPPWEEACSLYRYHAGFVPDAAVLEASRFRFQSPYVPVKQAFGQFAADCFPRGRPLLAAAEALMANIHEQFEFDSRATQVATPLAQVLEERRGVCQDFAHLMIACLRALGLPARYVSGYLLTHPPPGKPRLVGADASHAWVSLRCPKQGWIDFDPTNHVIPDTEHIVLGWGRDFGDVSPQRGVILGGGAHLPRVAVTVEPVAEAAPV